MSKRELLSERKLEGYLKLAKIIQWGRQRPVDFVELFFGISLLDFQKYAFMGAWEKPYVLWVMSRNAGKTTLAAPFIMAKSILFNNFQTYILAGTGSQSQGAFLKIEEITLQRISSFTGLTDVFANETVKSASNKTGFTHKPSSFETSLYNGSKINSLNSLPDNIRGHRSNLNFYDESGFTDEELFKASEPFLTQNSDFKLGGDIDSSLFPKQFPNQRIYASSASATDTYFYKLYRDFSQRMFLGDSDYFVADINSDLVINGTFNGVTLKDPLLSQSVVDAAMQDNPEKASREYSNIFTTEGSDQQVIKRASIVRNSELRPPVFVNPGGKKYIIAIDPARSYDNSVMTIAELVKDKELGYKLKIVNCVSFVDLKQKKKTPLKTPKQRKIFKRALADYNGQKSADYENIVQVLIDSGAGGAGLPGWADHLLDEWVDSSGKKRKGLIDENHTQYKDSIGDYPYAVSKLTLTNPKKRTELFNALRDAVDHDLISFTNDYEGKGELVFLDDKDKNTTETRVYKLSDDEKDALVNIDLAKEELVNIYEFKAGSSIRYDLAPHKRNKMHDDRAYTIAMLAWYLQELRRKEVVKEPEFDPKRFVGFRSSGF